MSDTPARDPCADFLEEPLPAPVDAALRQRLLGQTTRILRRRKWRKRAGVAAALAACYLAGAVTVYLLHAPAPAQTVVVTLESRSILPPRTNTATPSALVLENQALDSVQPRPELYRLAGDRYVAESGDLQSALRCYRQALDEASEQDLQIRPEDNWLLIALKEARQKEKENAKHVD
jgi:hypothetical protein